MFSSMPLACGVGRWIMAGRVIALDVMWARQQPALKRATAAVQVWVARGDCVGTQKSRCLLPEVAELQAEATAVAPASSPLLTRLTVSDKSGGKCSLCRNQREGGGVLDQLVWREKKTLHWVNIQ